MELTGSWELWVLGGAAALGVLLALARPLKWLAGLAVRTGAGLGVLALLGRAGGALGLHLGVNFFNALVLGLLGAPGFALLLMTDWLFKGL